MSSKLPLEIVKFVLYGFAVKVYLLIRQTASQRQKCGNFIANCCMIGLMIDNLHLHAAVAKEKVELLKRHVDVIEGEAAIERMDTT